jgi:hypothetical protein
MEKVVCLLGNLRTALTIKQRRGKTKYNNWLTDYLTPYTVLQLFSSFNDAISVTIEDIASNEWISQCWIGKDVVGHNFGLI